MMCHRREIRTSDSQICLELSYHIESYVVNIFFKFGILQKQKFQILIQETEFDKIQAHVFM